MRTQRAFSIQTPDQYYFCYNAILEHAQRQGLLPTNQWASALTSQTSPWTLRSLQSICKPRAVLCDQLMSPGKINFHTEVVCCKLCHSPFASQTKTGQWQEKSWLLTLRCFNVLTFSLPTMWHLVSVAEQYLVKYVAVRTNCSCVVQFHGSVVRHIGWSDWELFHLFCLFFCHFKWIV